MVEACGAQCEVGVLGLGGTDGWDATSGGQCDGGLLGVTTADGWDVVDSAPLVGGAGAWVVACAGRPEVFEVLGSEGAG